MVRVTSTDGFSMRVRLQTHLGVKREDKKLYRKKVLLRKFTVSIKPLKSAS